MNKSKFVVVCSLTVLYMWNCLVTAKWNLVTCHIYWPTFHQCEEWTQDVNHTQWIVCMAYWVACLHEGWKERNKHCKQLHMLFASIKYTFVLHGMTSLFQPKSLTHLPVRINWLGTNTAKSSSLWEWPFSVKYLLFVLCTCNVIWIRIACW
jgi:hypothetical protein